jgi:excisionase family DNA binding protein
MIARLPKVNRGRVSVVLLLPCAPGEPGVAWRNTRRLAKDPGEQGPFVCPSEIASLRGSRTHSHFHSKNGQESVPRRWEEYHGREGQIGVRRRPRPRGGLRVRNRQERLVRAAEAAAYLGVSLVTLRRMEKQGVLSPYRTLGGHRRYSIQMLEEYLESSRRLPAARNQ